MDVSNNSSIVALKKLLPLLILAMLPLLLWALTTKRFEIRKKAASGEMPLANAVHWKTETAALDAGNFYIKLNTSEPFDPKVMNTAPYGVYRTNQSVRSNPISTENPFYGTLEIEWTDTIPGSTDIPMRLFMYFKSDGVRWWSDEIRTYNGRSVGADWVYYKPTSGSTFFNMPIGRPFVGDITLSSTPIGYGTITFKNLRILPFFEGKCWSKIVPATTVENTAYNQWVNAGKKEPATCTPCIPFPALSGCTGTNCPFIPPPPSGDGYYCRPTPTCVPLPACANPVDDGPQCDPQPLPPGQSYCPTPTACTPLPACAYPATASQTPDMVTSKDGTILEQAKMIARPICKVGEAPPNGGVWCPIPTKTACTSVPPGCLDATGNLVCKIKVMGPICAPAPVTSCVGAKNGIECTGTNMVCPDCKPGERCPKMACRTSTYTGICKDEYCIQKPATLSPTPPQGCYYTYDKVTCIKAPCEPVARLVCPDQSCSGKPNGSACTIEGCEPCPPGRVCPMVCKPRQGSCSNQQCISAPTPTPSTDSSCVGAKDGSVCELPGCANECPPGKFCTDVCRLKYGTCASQKCIDGPTPTPPAGCTYRPVTCVQAPCEPILDCQITPTNVPAPSVTPPAGCTYQPIKRCMYQGACSITGWTLTCAPTPTPPASQTVSITFKYAGVVDDRAKNSKVKVRIVTPTSDVSTQALPVAYNATNKTYTVSFTNNQPLVPGNLYRFIVKGEKHVASAICYQVGQTSACKSTDWIKVSSVSYNYGVDYTARPLSVGDVSPQDNTLNQSDFDRLKALLTKSSASLTDSDKMICDLNYDGTCNTLDALLMRQSLETRPDEN